MIIHFVAAFYISGINIIQPHGLFVSIFCFNVIKTSISIFLTVLTFEVEEDAAAGEGGDTLCEKSAPLSYRGVFQKYLGKCSTEKWPFLLRISATPPYPLSWPVRKLPIGTLPLKSRAWNLCEKAAEHKKAEIHIQLFCQTIQLEIIPQKTFS